MYNIFYYFFQTGCFQFFKLNTTTYFLVYFLIITLVILTLDFRAGYFFLGYVMIISHIFLILFVNYRNIPILNN